MALKEPLKHVSAVPTNPKPQTAARKKFDVADLYREPLSEDENKQTSRVPLDEKLRQAYFWIVNNAIISPYYDIEFLDGPHPQFAFGDTKTRVALPSGQSYSSFVLLPLLTFAVQRKCLFIGGPGRGKTASAVLMGVLAGHSVEEVRRGMQHGQPQMTVSDLLGTPLPADLMNARKADDIRIAWRSWLGMRVKIIDEYNRIPTRTQSALLTVMADNYAELFDQVFECPEAAWYLTANDDAGGGTYQVIEALRDRIDIVVHALSFNMRFLKDLLIRIEEDVKPEEIVPPQVIFSEEEIRRLHREVLAVEIPEALRRRLEFFASQFEFCESAASQFEYQTKDTARLAGIELHALFAQESGRDKFRDLGAQTLNGISVRSLLTLLVFAKAVAYFRGNRVVGLDDLRQIIPFVLHDKLAPDTDAPYFDASGNAPLRLDRVSWIRRLFDLSCAEYDRLNLDKDDPVGELQAQFSEGLENLPEGEVRQRLARIERILSDWSKGRKAYGHLYDDVIKLKYLHQRYLNYLRWLNTQ